MFNVLTNIAIRMIVFAAVGVSGSLMVHKGHIDVHQTLSTLAVFLILNILWEGGRRSHHAFIRPRKEI
jgi:hypothetical protein